MLLSLDIKNAALIEHLCLEISDGLTVLTGETGAGKSVIIDTINMILGARTSKALVRYGEKKAVLQAAFYVENSNFLEEYGIDAEDNMIIITREIYSDGKSICRINGVITPQNIVREITGELINIHGQHDSQALLNPATHIKFLDSYAKNTELLSDYERIYNKKKEIEYLIADLECDEEEKQRKSELLEYQIEEISKASIRVGEKEELSEQRLLIGNAEKISLSLNEAYEALYNAENSAYDAVSRASSSVMKIQDFDQRFLDISQKLSEIGYSLEDISHEIYDISSKTEYDEKTLNDIEERLDCINKLERKYGGTEEKVLEFLEKAKDELSKITNADEERQRLFGELSLVLKELSECAKRLSEKRKEAAKILSKEIENELFELDMPKAKFSILIEPLEDFSKNGADRVEFLISPNMGEPEKPLFKIASGGELSRVMLAIKGILASYDGTDTLIFDEIDTGVSGSAAKKIAQKLAVLGEKKQVICVTHLPQLAAAADNHYLIKKIEEKERTLTTASILFKEERIEEIARITDGENPTPASKEHARQMIEEYKNIKA